MSTHLTIERSMNFILHADEMYFKTGNNIPEELETARQQARQTRAESNRKHNCEDCWLQA